MSLRIYVAGPMRGKPMFNAPAFDDATRRLRALGHEVFNPAEHDRAQHGVHIHDLSNSGDLTDLAGTGFNLRTALRDDLTWIAENADAVAVLPGWEHSKGAKAEVALAHALDLIVAFVNEFEEAAS
jgi:hypothetical protein